MTMHRVSLLLLAACLLLGSGAAAAEQVTCESTGQNQVSCDMNTQGEVRMVKQLSHAACTEGVSWGLSKHSVWVSNGCRAVFSSDGASNQASADNSANNGATRLTCESVGKARTECAMNTGGEVRMSKQLSRAACVEGTSWGLSKHAVWVSDGCRAEFENTSAAGHSAPSHANAPTSGQIRACNAVEDRYGQVVSSTALKPGAWEIILSYDDGKYVCNVDAGEKVSYFEKMKN
jgi:Protein of unknown function (DUF3011)